MSDSFEIGTPDQLDRLTEQQQSQLTELLDEYLQQLEQGVRLDAAELTVDHPQLRDVFACYVAKLDAIHGIADELPSSDRIELGSLDKNGVCCLGEFEIIQEIGRGGMGTVYEARQPALNRRVALKLLPMTAMFDSRQVARFKNEANAAGQLHHPNIVPIYGVGSAQRIHYYSMQLIDGISIDQWIRRQATEDSEDWQQPVRWAIEIAGALQCAHESGIVHRDVKPSNLLLDRSNRIWITDFGLARCQTDLALTQSGDMIGTLRYMSPEQAAGKPQVLDHRTDIYSLAATLFEMLSLRPAVQGDDSASVLKQLDRDEPIRLKGVRPDLPTDLSVVLQMAMAKRKDDRYESADQFASDLQSVLDGTTTVARPRSPLTIVQRFAVRHRLAMATAAGVLGVVFVLLTVSSAIIFRQNQDILGHKLRADQNFNRARTTVDQLGATVAERLASIPGTERIRRSLLEDTLDYYKQFIDEATGNRDLQTEIATTHTKIGCLISELENSEKAIPHFQRAAECFKDLPQAETNDYTVQGLIAANGNHLGLALAASGRVSEALMAYQQAIALHNKILTSQVSDPNSVIQLATIQNNLGLLYRQLDQRDAARAQFAESIRLLEGLNDDRSTRTLRSRSIAAALSNLSSLTLESDPQESTSLLETAIAQRLGSLENSSNRLQASSEIAMMYSNLGSARIRLNELVAAASAFDSAIRLQRQLHSIAPAVQLHRRDLAMSLNNIAMVRYRQSNPTDSAVALQEGVELQRSLVAVGSNTVDRTRLGAMEHNLAVALIALNENDRAEALFTQAINRQKSVLIETPKAKASAAYLRQHYLASLRSQVRRGQWTKMRATESALRESAGGNSQSLNEIETEIRSVRTQQTRNRPKSVAMVSP